MWGLAMLSLATSTGAWAQDAIVGEKGTAADEGIVGEKRPANEQGVIGEKRPANEQGVIGDKTQRGNGVVGEKGRATQSGATSVPMLLPEASRLLRQPTTAVRYRPPAVKLQQLPAEVRTTQLQTSDLGTPFRIEPASPPGTDRQWYASQISSLTSAMDVMELVSSGGRNGGGFGVAFPVQAGYRYLVDCAMARATDFEFSHSGLGPVWSAGRVTANDGIVTLVSAPVTGAGRARVEFEALSAPGATWQWRGCEITPLRVR
ncbi:hypothetical protein GCM10027400_11710 [Pseudoxanthomonas daejeonensis]